MSDSEPVTDIPTVRATEAGPPLALLVAALPELYQPIFGHPELSQGASRGHDRRLDLVAAVHDVLRAHLGRPLRVLDLGCAQGFFSFGLAARGSMVKGVDYQQPNVAVCQAVAAERPDLAVDFQVDSVENVLLHLRPGQYDLVLGLSVFHHMVHQHGLAAVRNLLAAVSDKVEMGVFELALAGEPLYWAAAQPDDPRALLAPFAFVHEIARNPTHLSGIERPLFAASNRHWLLDGRIGTFQSWQSESHAYAKGAARGTRRYFIGGGVVVKSLRLEQEPNRTANLNEYGNEVALLQAPPPGLDLPILRLHGRSDREAWIVRDLIPGELLLDRILDRRPYDHEQVLRQVLDQMVALEEAGLYHNDLRVWNVVMTPGERAAVIDYGGVSRAGTDCAWPKNLLLAFMIFVAEVLDHAAARPEPLRPPALNPDAYPEPWRSRFWSLLERPAAEWSFVRLRAICDAVPAGAEPVGDRSGIAAVILAMEQAIAVHKYVSSHSLELAQQAADALEKVKGVPPSRR